MASEIRDSSRVFVGGVAVAALTWAYATGHIFAPVGETVAYAISPPVEGEVRGVGDLLANVLTGALYIVGELFVVATTVAWKLTKSIAGGLLKFLMSFTESGREILEAWNDRSNDAVVIRATGDADIAKASGATAIPPQVAERLAIAEKTLAELIPAIQRNRNGRKDHAARILNLESQNKTIAAELLRLEEEKISRKVAVKRASS